jgi:hypothetical protein
VTSEERSGSGTFVYHPLLPGSPLAELWRASHGQAAAPVAAPSDLTARQYRLHLGARLLTAAGAAPIALPDRLDEDDRPLVREFRAFFPAFLERCGAPAQIVGSGVHFPIVRYFDARAVERGERATFITSRVLDVVELFAATMSMCARLNGLAMGALLAAEDPPPDIVAFAWLPLMQDGSPGFTLDHVDGAFAAPDPEALLRDDLVPSASFLGPEAARAMSRWRLTHYLAQAMLLALEHLVEGRTEDAAPWLECARPPRAVDVPLSIDAHYLADLVLAFIAIHEQAHVVHNHNSFEPPVEDPQLDALVGAAMQHAGDEGASAQDLRGSTLQLEQDADCFPFEVAPEDDRDALLDAASLWLAALAAADRGGHDWLAATTASQGRLHPQYAMRVWFVNGRYSSGARAGEVAMTARRAAEAIQARASVHGRYAPDTVLSVFRALWAIARDEVGEGARAGGGWLSRLRRRR